MASASKLGLLDQGDFTAGEVARRIAITTDDEEVARTVQRIKHWARNGLLKPKVTVQGPGKYRRYTERSVYEAALLLHLQQAEQAIKITQTILEILRLDDEFFVRAFLGRGNPVHISIPMAGSYRVLAREKGIQLKDVSHGVGIGTARPRYYGTQATFINLTEIFKGVRASP